MKVSLFGGTGFIGSYITEELLNQNHIPHLLVRENSKNTMSSHLCKVIYGDVKDGASIEKTIINTECVIYNIGIIREYRKTGITFSELHT